MLKCGGKAKIINNITQHYFQIEEIVTFVGVELNDQVVFMFTNGKIIQGLYQREFEILNV